MILQLTPAASIALDSTASGTGCGKQVDSNVKSFASLEKTGARLARIIHQPLLSSTKNAWKTQLEPPGTQYCFSPIGEAVLLKNLG